MNENERVLISLLVAAGVASLVWIVLYVRGNCE